MSGGFPGGPVVKNPLSNARNMSAVPDWGAKMPSDVGQLSSHGTTREAQALQPRPRTTEKNLHNSFSSF